MAVGGCTEPIPMDVLGPSRRPRGGARHPGVSTGNFGGGGGEADFYRELKRPLFGRAGKVSETVVQKGAFGESVFFFAPLTICS